MIQSVPFALCKYESLRKSLRIYFWTGIPCILLYLLLICLHFYNVAYILELFTPPTSQTKTKTRTIFPTIKRTTIFILLLHSVNEITHLLWNPVAQVTQLCASQQLGNFAF